MIRCVIVEDFQPLREAYSVILSSQEDIRIVGLFSNGSELLEWMRGRAEQDEPMDVVLMDIEMESRKDGIEALKRLKEQQENVKCIMLTCHEEEEYIVEALESGATNYLIKTADPRRIVEVVRSAMEGNSSFDAVVSNTLAQYMRNAQPRRESLLYAMNQIARLTASELDVLRLTLEGKSKKQIAQERSVELGTVKVQIGSILKKFECSRMTQVAKIIRDLGLERFITEAKSDDL